eukprot:SAG22_NODE_3444_length_1708_cov_1.110628_1_plen_358_part_10
MPESPKITNLLQSTTELIIKEATTNTGDLKFWCVNPAGVTTDLNPLEPVVFVHVLQKDDVVTVEKIASTRSCKSRVLTKLGWVSIVAVDGTVLMKPIDGSHLAMEARDTFRNGDVSSAVQLWSEAINRSPSCRDLVNVATAHFKLGDYASAIACVEQAITIEPNYAKAFYRKGRILTAMGKPLEAQMNLEKALELQPDDPQIMCCLAKVRSDHVFYRVRTTGAGGQVQALPELNPRHRPADDGKPSSIFEFFSSAETRPAARTYSDGQLVEVFEVRPCSRKPRWRARTADGWVALTDSTTGEPQLELVDRPVVGVRHTLEQQLQQMADELREAKAAQERANMRQREETKRASVAEAER